ncbi:MAG: hypothetical protein ACJ8DO_06875 [Microvirga sp.]
MSVYSSRRSIRQFLIGNLPSTSVIVAGPDHPLLSRGPDVLVGSTKGLLAIFVVHAAERRSPPALQARFMLSRLAFPRDTRFALAFEGRDELLAKKFYHDFAAIFPLTDRSALRSIAETPRQLNQRLVPKDIYVGARTRFAETYEVTRMSIDRLKPAVRSLHTDSKPTVEYYVGPADIAIARYSAGALGTAQMNRLVQTGALESFHLDNGIPYPTNSPSGLAIVDQIPMQRGDPNLRARAAAFAGWAMLSEQFENELSRLSWLLSKRTRQGS